MQTNNFKIIYKSCFIADKMSQNSDKFRHKKILRKNKITIGNIKKGSWQNIIQRFLISRKAYAKL